MLATRSMIEVEVHAGPAVLPIRAYSVGVPAQHKSRQETSSILATTDLLNRRAPVGKLQCRSFIGDADIQIEFVETCFDHEGAAVPAILRDRLDQLYCA